MINAASKDGLKVHHINQVPGEILRLCAYVHTCDPCICVWATKYLL